MAGSLLAYSNHILFFEVFDGSGNSKTCSFTLKVNDTTMSTINSEFSENTMALFPNPLVDILTIKNNRKSKLLSLVSRDSFGKALNRINLSKMNKVKMVPLLIISIFFTRLMISLFFAFVKY